MGKRGARLTTGLPGTGLSAMTNLTPAPKSPKPKGISRSNIIDQQQEQRIGSEPSTGAPSRQFSWKVIGIIIALIVFLCAACLAFGVFLQIFFPTQPTVTPIPQITQTTTATILPTNTSTPTSTSIQSSATPSNTQTPSPTETLPPNCLQEYPSFCVLPGKRIACDQLPNNFIVLPPDSLGYDGDGDGFGCEN